MFQNTVPKMFFRLNEAKLFFRITLFFRRKGKFLNRRRLLRSLLHRRSFCFKHPIHKRAVARLLIPFGAIHG